MVEDKILEYLDGSLSDRERAELLETLSLNPEKRALLEEHLRLKDLLALGRKPFTVPIETERSLAERIPILGKYNDNLAPFTGRFAALRNWASARPLRIAAGTAAMLVLAAFGWYALNRTSAKHIVPAGSAMARAVPSLTNSAANIPQANSGTASAFATNSSNVLAGHRIVRLHAASRQIINDDPMPLAASAKPSDAGTPEIQAVNPALPANVMAMAIPDGHFASTMSELLLTEPRNLSPLSVGGSFILNQLYLPVPSGPSNSILVPTGDVSLDYNLSPNFAVGLDAGTAEGTALNNSGIYQTLANNYDRFTQSAALTSQMFYDFLLTTHLTLFPESAYQIRLGIAGGDAFGAGPVAEVSAGVSRVIAPNLIFDLTATLGRVWTNGNPSGFTPPPSSGVVGIVGQQVARTSLYSTAFGVSAGLRMRLPD